MVCAVRRSGCIASFRGAPGYCIGRKHPSRTGTREVSGVERKVKAERDRHQESRGESPPVVYTKNEGASFYVNQSDRGIVFHPGADGEAPRRKF